MLERINDKHKIRARDDLAQNKETDINAPRQQETGEMIRTEETGEGGMDT